MAKWVTTLSDYIRTHWRGEHSLARAYWVNVFTVSALFYVSTQILSSLPYWDTASPAQILLFVCAATAAALMVWIWQIVGCWRSAIKRIEKTGKGGWSRVVQILLVFGVFGTLGQLSSIVTMIAEIARITLRQDEMQEVAITLIDGTELEINGYITFDVPEEVEKYLSIIQTSSMFTSTAPEGESGRQGV